MAVSFFFFLSLWLYSPLNLGRFFSFLIPYIVGRTSWTGYEPVARPLPTHRTTHTSMPRVGFDLTISVFERAKTVHALECATAVIDGTRQLAVSIQDQA
jgi:hypothetical protein